MKIIIIPGLHFVKYKKIPEKSKKIFKTFKSYDSLFLIEKTAVNIKSIGISFFYNGSEMRVKSKEAKEDKNKLYCIFRLT